VSLMRETPEGRAMIAEAVRLLREWCRREGVRWDARDESRETDREDS